MVDGTDGGTAASGTIGTSSQVADSAEHVALREDTRRDATKVAALALGILARENVGGDDADDIRKIAEIALAMDARTGRRDPSRRRRRSTTTTG